MPQQSDNTPILVGVGQIKENTPHDLSSASSPIDLAASAAQIALEDSATANIVDHIDTLVMVRMFADSSPSYDHRYGKSNNPPRSVAAKISCDPKHAIYSSVGGHMPQALINEFATKLLHGEHRCVLLVGAEALATQRKAQRTQSELDWTDHAEGSLDDRGMFTENLVTYNEVVHQMSHPMEYYALMENARRHAQGVSRDDYRYAMGQRFSALSKTAAENPHAVNRQEYDIDTLIRPSPDNPLVIEPYTKNLIAKDTVNQAAAVILTTVAQAKFLSIPEEKWIYLHAAVDANDQFLLEREKLGQSTALLQALEQALVDVNMSSRQIDQFDLYSCFPIVVSEACDFLEIKHDDQRPISQTGGLPYFGGAGNNYSMHAIASMVEKLRTHRDQFGMVLANGGWMSKISIGIYSAQPNQLALAHSKIKPNTERSLSSDALPSGEAVLESYTYRLKDDKPERAIAIGRLKNSGKRFYATVPLDDSETLSHLAGNAAIGETIFVQSDPKGNRFAFNQEQVNKFEPPIICQFKNEYKHCLVEQDGPILRVTINRPNIGNALHPPANEELTGVFNAFEKDSKLRVAILTGAGDRYFCTGNDLKYMASGKHMYVPAEGFAGLTSRKNRTKPIIAQVNGIAVGGGLEIALACDIIVAVDHAIFALPEIHVGLFAGAGGIQRLTRQISHKAAMEILLTGNPVLADDAREMGMINYVTPAGKLAKKSDELAHQIARASPEAIRATLSVYHQTAHLASCEEAVNFQHNAFDALLNGNDFWEGSRAFLEKRQPNWILKE